MSCVVDSVENAWKDIRAVFGLQGEPMSATTTLSKSTLRILKEKKISLQVLDFLQAEVESRLRSDIVPAFWTHFQENKSHDEVHSKDLDKSDIFQSAVNDLYLRVCGLSEFINRMDKLAKDVQCQTIMFNLPNYDAVFKVLLRGTLHSQLPQNYEEPIHAFYAKAFNVFHSWKNKNNQQQSDDMEDDDEEEDEEFCKGCFEEKESCKCKAIIALFHDTNQKLLFMDLLERLTSNVVTQLINHQIQSHVQYTCQGSFTMSHLKNLEVWLQLTVMSWITVLFSASSTGSTTDTKTLRLLKTFHYRLRHYLYEVYTKERINQIYNIIIEFPDSQPALEDLRECLAKTDLRPVFVKSLRSVLEQKLLHLGVKTSDILSAYISAIRALRFLDPSGILLELVCEPVRKYLRTRDDTVRCIVQNLIDDSSSELADELLKSDRQGPDESIVAALGEVDLDASDMVDTWQEWQPDPVDVEPSRSPQSLSHRSSDIISMLVNIYGSKKRFVDEYREMLSNRLLSQFSYNTDKEIRNLELLKLRFGEEDMQKCEVMLKDIGDSKRINNVISGSEDGEETEFKLPFPVNALILSRKFWPTLKGPEDLELPKEVLESLECYGKAFESLKKIRTLVWKTHLGFANLDLHIGDKQVNVTVSPAQAAIIYQFQEKAEWTANELSQILKIPVSALQRNIAFWITQGFIRETSPDHYSLVEEGPTRRMSGHMSLSTEDDESESYVRTSSDERAEELQVFWSYIVNMLINLESLPLDRIFQMLKMFAMADSSAVECDINQLRAFLDEKVRQHELVNYGGHYKLPKP